METHYPPQCPYQLLILDCDGVVVDSEPITTRVLCEMLNALGVAIDLEQVVEMFSGHTFPRILERVTELLGRPLPGDFVNNYVSLTVAALEAELLPVPGIELALDEIEIPYCIASNGPHEKMRKTLGITALLPRFEGRMFSATQVPRGKPHPDLFLFAAQHFGVPPSACVVVEDSPSGVTGAVAAGMTVLGFAEASNAGRLFAAGAHGVFSRMADLSELLRRKTAPPPTRNS